MFRKNVIYVKVQNFEEFRYFFVFCFDFIQGMFFNVGLKLVELLNQNLGIDF